jgi:hypothetical protein
MKYCTLCRITYADSDTRCERCGGLIYAERFRPKEVGLSTLAIPAALIAGIVFLVVYGLTDSDRAPASINAVSTRSESAATDAEGALLAAGGCDATDVWIENKSQAFWENTRIEINGAWEYRPGVVPPGRQPYMPQLFTRTDGTRLSLASMACKTLDIHATVNGKRASWNGARR